MRLRCKALGCVCDDGHSCSYCGTDLYDGFIEQCGCWFRLYYSLRHHWQSARRFRHHRCEACGKPMFMTDDYCCSHKCYDEWTPF